MKTQPYLDQETLKALLHYSPDTGVFIWLWRADVPPNWNGRYAGKVAGYARECTREEGAVYWSIKIYGHAFKAHRLAVLYMTGEWPETIVDHHNTDGLNNRWDNLRDANRSQNGANAKLSKANTSGLKGASFHKRAGKYQAVIRVGGRQAFLGYHDTAEAAHAAYCAAATSIHGEFARAA
jgi:hypothetical protein